MYPLYKSKNLILKSHRFINFIEVLNNFKNKRKKQETGKDKNNSVITVIEKSQKSNRTDKSHFNYMMSYIDYGENYIWILS